MSDGSPEIKKQDLQTLKDGGLFADPETIRLSPAGVVDSRSGAPYVFNEKQARRAKELGVEVDAKLPSAYEPFHDERGQPVLVPSVVCQLDVLGTSAATEDRAHENLELTQKALSAAQQWGVQLDDYLVARWFTDNAVIVAADREGLLEGLATSGVVLVVAAMQLELSLDGLFSRGGLAYGEAYASPMFVYGNAVVAAHKLEEKVAHYPRVVASDEIRREHLKVPGMEKEMNALVAVDHDGLAFISYLGMVLDKNGKHQPDDVLPAHRDIVAKRLREHSGVERYAAKCGWVADYHDRFCRLHFPDRPDFLLDPGGSARLRQIGS